MADAQEQQAEFSGGRLVDRPAQAPANSIFYAHDTGERFRFMHGNWHLIDNVQQVEHEQMEHPGQDVIDAADALRAAAATTPQAASGDSGDAGQTAPPPARPAKKVSK